MWEERDWSDYWSHVHKNPDIFESASFSFRVQKFPRPHVIGFVADYSFSLWRADSKISGITGCVWTEALSGMKKFGYMGRGLKLKYFSLQLGCTHTFKFPWIFLNLRLQYLCSDYLFLNFCGYCQFLAFYVPVKSKLQHPPLGNPRAFVFFAKFLFKFPPPESEKVFKCPIIGPFQVIKCSHPRETFR